MFLTEVWFQSDHIMRLWLRKPNLFLFLGRDLMCIYFVSSEGECFAVSFVANLKQDKNSNNEC